MPKLHVKRLPSRRTLVIPALALIAFCALFAGGSQPDETPIGPRWWPSEWGADDQRGAANRLTPAKVLEAKSLIKTGKVYQLGQVYEYGMPLPGKRHFKLTIPGLPTYPPEGKNQGVGNDEMLSAEIGQVGTQFDGLGHVGCRVDGEDIFYNGNKLSEFGDSYGLKKLGVEHVGVFVTRGVLLDILGYLGRKSLPNGFVITPEHIQGCLDSQGVDIRPGDVVVIRTGHSRLWMKDNETYGKGEPGIGMAAAKFLTEKKICLIGADTWAIEAVPGEDPERPFEVHQWTLPRNGIYHLENLRLEELAADKAYEFAFFFSPVPIKGATGSPGNPVAIR